jgi:hypothetical protein
MPDLSALRDRRPYLIRLRNEATGAWLHLSGSGETRDRAQSWAGTRDQAANLRKRAEARGEPWPYVRARLEETEGAQ